jgi:hypothetical protein
MRTLPAGAMLLLSTFGSAAFAASGNLDGWERLRFGMTTAEVLQIAGHGAEYEDTFLSGPVVVWRIKLDGQPAQVAAFVPDGKLNSIKVFLPNIQHETKQECHERLDATIKSLSKQYGAPDEETTDQATGNEVTAWHAIYKFQNAATIEVDADLHDADLTCTADLIYESHK